MEVDPTADGFVQAFHALQQRVAQLEGGQHAPSTARDSPADLQGLTQPSPFSGEADEDPTSWLFSCNMYFDLLAADSGRRVRMAASMLRGPALLWWRMHHQSVEKGECTLITEWDEFGRALQQQFSPVNPTTTARNRLYSLVQRSSVPAYADEFRRLVLRIPDLSAEEQVHRFINGLKPHIRTHVALRDPTTLDQAIRAADTCERYVPTPTSNRVPRYERKPAAVSNADPDAMQVDAVALQPLTQQQRDQLRRIGGCFRCRRPGHMARECPRYTEQRGTTSGNAGAQ
jgi:hypothetical protein